MYVLLRQVASKSYISLCNAKAYIREVRMSNDYFDIDFQNLSKTHSTAKLEIATLGGSVRRQDVEKKIKEDYKAKKDAGKYNLPTYKDHIQPVTSIHSAMRVEFKDNTSDWNGKGGERLIPNVLLDKMTTYVDEKTLECERVLEEQLSTYEEYKEQAREDLGDLYREQDWPTADEIRNRHRITFRQGVVPDPDQDVRAGVSPDQRDRIRRSVKRQIAENVNSAKQDLANQMTDVIRKVRDSLSNYKGTKENSFRNSLIGNVRDMATVVSQLNPNDKEVEDVIMDIMNTISTLDPDDLRKDEIKRKKAINDANNILNNIGSFGSSIN